MTRVAISAVLLTTLAACGESASIPETDLRLEITVGAEEVELGQAFPVTVVRVWDKALTPEAWDDGLLTPLVLRQEVVSQVEDDRRVMETRRFRAYAFARDDIRIRAPRLVATTAAGEERVAVADPVRLQVWPLLDPDDPGEPELAAPLSVPDTPTVPWFALIAVLFAFLAYGLVHTRPDAVEIDAEEPAEPRRRPDRVALEALARTPGVAEAADIVRAYVAERFDVHALEMSTEEVLVAMGARGDALESILRPADRVKFADHEPTAAESHDVIERARGFVEETT